MSRTTQQLRSRSTGVAAIAALPSAALFLIVFIAVVLSHITLLRLPYFWDEAGYYIPAALDFYHRFTLIPEFTNAHPPLPNVVLGSLWHVFGYHIFATRIIVCAFAAAGLVAVFRLAEELIDANAAIAVTLLTAVYPIWFAQSTLAHADIFAAAFTLWAFALYFREQARLSEREHSEKPRYVAVVMLFSLAALSKETAIIEPSTLACYQLFQIFRRSREVSVRRLHVRWFVALSATVLPLLAWYAYHRAQTGFTFGNPEYLRYNATANLTVSHFLTALRYRFVHLAWQRNIWFPLVAAAACLLFIRRRDKARTILPFPAMQIIAVLVAANWIAFSILGGALLTRYLLPIYPLILLACVAIWRMSTLWWPALAALTASAFLVALWWSPPVAYAPEDTLTYRDMIVVHQQAVAFIDQHYPDARVLTSWPASEELYRADMGYTDHKIMGPEIDNFSTEEIAKAAQESDRFDTALVFSKNFVSPALARYLGAHPESKRAQDFATHHDLYADEIAVRLGGQVVYRVERNGEWAAVLRFPRRYNAGLSTSDLLYTSAVSPAP